MITWRRFLLDTCVLAGLAMAMVVVGVFAAPALVFAVGRHALPEGAQIVFTSATQLHFWGLVAAFALPPIAAWLVDLIDHLRGRDAPSSRRLLLVALAVIATSAALIWLSTISISNTSFGGFTPMYSIDELVKPSMVVVATIAVVPIAAFLFRGTTSLRPSAAPAPGSGGSGAAGSPGSPG